VTINPSLIVATDENAAINQERNNNGIRNKPELLVPAIV
jgi:hypothetical protein